MRSSNSEVPQEEVPNRLEQKNHDYSQEKHKSMRARFLYGIIFSVMNLKAWFFHDYGQKVLAKFNYIKACRTKRQDCCHMLGVLRVSLGCFIFFFIMFFSTIKTRKLYEARSTWHSAWWSLKLFLLIISTAVPFFFPSKYIQLYVRKLISPVVRQPRVMDI